MQYDVNTMKYEFKYVVPIELLSELRSRISPFVIYDDYMDCGDSEGYTVRSIYFDTPWYDYFHEKIDGLNERKKLRIRGYNEHNPENTVFFEIKRKYNKRIRKNRVPVSFKYMKELLVTGNIEKFISNGNGSKRGHEDCSRFLYHIYRSSLQPTVLVTYTREAFFGKFDRSLRITFDKNLRSTIHPGISNLFQENDIRYSSSNHFIFEVKFYHRFPEWLKPINASLGLTLGTFSKYVTCIKEHMVIHNNTKQLKHNCIKAMFA